MKKIILLTVLAANLLVADGLSLGAFAKKGDIRPLFGLDSDMYNIHLSRDYNNIKFNVLSGLFGVDTDKAVFDYYGNVYMQLGAGHKHLDYNDGFYAGLDIEYAFSPLFTAHAGAYRGENDYKTMYQIGYIAFPFNDVSLRVNYNIDILSNNTKERYYTVQYEFKF